jgi:hypothetical protein
LAIRDSLFLPADILDGNPVEGNVLPNSTRKIKIDWLKFERPANYTPPSGVWKRFWGETYYEWKNFALGFYSAHLDLTYGTKGEEVKKTAYFLVFPWELVLVIAVILLVVFWGGKKLIRRYNKFIIEKARAGMQ